MNGIVLLELHIALLYGQVIDLDARNNINRVCPQPRGCLLWPGKTGLLLRMRGLCQLWTQELLHITDAVYKGNGAVARPWCAATPRPRSDTRWGQCFKQETWSNTLQKQPPFIAALCVSRSHHRKSVLHLHPCICSPQRQVSNTVKCSLVCHKAQPSDILLTRVAPTAQARSPLPLNVPWALSVGGGSR